MKNIFLKIIIILGLYYSNKVHSQEMFNDCSPREYYITAVFHNGMPNESIEQIKFNNISVIISCDSMYCKTLTICPVNNEDTSLLILSKKDYLYRYHVSNSRLKNFYALTKNTFPLCYKEKFNICEFNICFLKDTLFNSKSYLTKKNKKKLKQVIDNYLINNPYIVLKLFNITAQCRKKDKHILNEAYVTIYRKGCSFDYYDELKEQIRYDEWIDKLRQ